MLKLHLLFIVFLFASLAPLIAHAKRAAAAKQPAVQARAAIVVDLTSGRTLYAKHADRRLPVASLTKLLTAMVVLDSKHSLLKPARITDADVDRLKWSRSRLPVGSLLLRKTMLHIALMSSENRAAFALSRDYPGGRAGFVRAMNRTAKRLAMNRSHFVDPTGLSPHNGSTARDLTRLARAAYRYPTIREFATSHHKLVLGGEGPLVYRNTDPLVYRDAWHVGLQKTGFTNEAGHCLIVIATVRGRPTLFVILGAPSVHGHFQDAERLRSWLLKR
ncbi:MULTISPECIES: serine hydrolase [unclassified Caballeronia]|uniref:serine hydrolase n=1 Tax=unclassified Caballeronia TaxID=2646786 RepID=UPI001F263DE0|nr:MULTISPECIES: serine hydrolase [unclassified Caballeronia]MCE4547063.1 serine hydrolase [Caballeronia sp. PC1]MCE4572464.1 serine hydrolase [Caballeronia sp. CLC5]